MQVFSGWEENSTSAFRAPHRPGVARALGPEGAEGSAPWPAGAASSSRPREGTDICQASQGGRGQSLSPGSPSWLFSLHHQLFDPRVTQRQRRKESKIQLAGSKRVKHKGRPGPRGSHGTTSLGFAVLWPPGLGPWSPTHPTQGSWSGKQTLGLQGGALAGPRHMRGPHPIPEGVPATIPRGESRQAEAEWRQAWIWPPGEDLLAPAGIAPPPAPASLIPSPGLGGVCRQRETADGWKEPSPGPLTACAAGRPFLCVAFSSVKLGVLALESQPVRGSPVECLPSARHTVGAQLQTAAVMHPRGSEWNPHLPNFLAAANRGHIIRLFHRSVSMPGSPEPRPCPLAEV